MPGMGTKRSFKEVDTSTFDRKEDGGGHRGKKPKIKQQSSKEETIGWVKKRARDIERILQRDSSTRPANVQNDLERELAAHRSRIADEKDRKLRGKMISKYHMVRFFERKKAMRLQKRLQSQLKNATDPAEIAALNADIHITEVDINYAKYFPFLEPYISMYKSPKATEKEDEKSSAEHALHSERPPLWSTIEKAMEEGESALERLRDRRQGPESGEVLPPQPGGAAAARKAKASKKAKKEKQAEPPKHSEDSRPKKAEGAKKWVNPYKKKMQDAREGTKHEEASGSESDGGGFFEE